MQGESVGLTIPRNYFDLSQEHVFTAEAGLIYPDNARRKRRTNYTKKLF
nr:MAG TPA: hypothetical protein [Microviridae sp.]